MRKKITLVSVLFGCLFSANIFAQVSVTVNGIAKLNGTSDYSNITVAIRSYKIAGEDVYGINQTVTTDASGNYNFSFTTPSLCYTYQNQTLCPEYALIPLYISFTKDKLTDTINENIPLSKPFSGNVTYTISKSIVLGGYIPQIGMVSVDTTFGVNKNMIIWERKDTTTIVRYNILKASTINGAYSIIGSVAYDTTYTVFRDLQSNPGVDKAFYKIEAVYSDNSKSPLSYPKSPLSLQVNIGGDNIPTLSFLNKEDIPLFDHSLYKSIIIKRADGDSRLFNTFYTFDFTTAENSALIAMLSGWSDNIQTMSKYTYLVVGELANYVKTHLKSDSGPFSQSLSNLAESELTNSKIINDNPLTVGPNPSNGILSITVPEDGIISVIDAIGQTISTFQVTKGFSQLELKSSGIYTIILKASKAYKTKVAIK